MSLQQKTFLGNAVLEQLGKLLILVERSALKMERTCKCAKEVPNICNLYKAFTFSSCAERQELCVQEVFVPILQFGR